MSVVGIDIGGANLKASDGHKSVSWSFPLWKHPEKLAAELQRLLAEFHPYGPIAATMTGELADCFRTRAEGVKQIVSAIQDAANKRQVAIWQTGGEFFSADEAMEIPELVAAANWHALATWSGRACPTGLAILIDIGSTTTDMIPIDSGLPVPTGTTDLQRLCSGELVYTGVRRTPLFAVTSHVEISGQRCSLAAEIFATTLDLAILLEEIVEDVKNCDTANSRPATKEESFHRLARMVCSDCDQFTDDELIDVAQQIQDSQLATLANALRQVLGSQNTAPSMVLLSGEGEFLAKQLLQKYFADLPQLETISLNQTLGTEHSQVACAYALARLGTERL